MKKLMILLCTLMLTMSCTMTAFACTPKYSVTMPKIPEIKVELSDEMKEAVKQAAQKQLEKMILDKPVIWSTECRTHGDYSFCTITWRKVEGATSYKVEITKADGAKKIYDTTGNWLAAHSYRDEFVSEGMGGATVRVRAYGEDETYSMWSEKKTVSNGNVY